MKICLRGVARLLVASIVTVSFLITVAPLGTTPSAAAGTMECCVGKAGHEGGACSSGLLTSSTTPQSEASGDAGETSGSILDSADGGIHAQSAEESGAPETTEAEHAKVAAISRNCAGECGTCSTSFNRQPRPREQSNLANKPKLQLPTSSRIRCAENLHVNTLQRVTTQLRPRAPPAPSV
jgi:hypothetical protein